MADQGQKINQLDDFVNTSSYKQIEDQETHNSQIFEVNAQGQQINYIERVDKKSGIGSQRPEINSSKEQNTNQEQLRTMQIEGYSNQKTQVNELVAQEKEESSEIISSHENKKTNMNSAEEQNINQKLKEKARFLIKTMLQIRQLLKKTFPKLTSRINSYDDTQFDEKNNNYEFSKQQIQLLGKRYELLIEELLNWKTELAQKRKDLDDEKSRLEEEKSKRQQNQSRISKQNSDLQKNLYNLQEEKKSQKKQLDQIFEKYEVVFKQLSQIKAQLENEKILSSNLKSQITKNKKQNDENINRSKETNDSIKDKHQKQLKLTRDSLLNQKKQAQNQLNAKFLEKCNELDLEKKENNKKISELSQQMQILQKKIQQKQTQILQHLNELQSKEEQLINLQQTNDNQKTQLITVTRQKQSFAIKLGQSQTKLNHLIQQSKDLQNNLKLKLYQKETKLVQKQQFIKDLQKEHETILEDKEKQLRQERQKRESLIEKLKQKSEQLDKQILNNQRNLNDFKNQMQQTIENNYAESLKQMQLKQNSLIQLTQKNKQLQGKINQNVLQIQKLITQLQCSKAQTDSSFNKNTLQNQQFQRQKKMMESNIDKIKLQNQEYEKRLASIKESQFNSHNKLKSIAAKDRGQFIQKLNETIFSFEKQNKQSLQILEMEKNQVISQKEGKIKKLEHSLKASEEEYAQLSKKIQSMRYSCGKIVQSYQNHEESEANSFNQREKRLIEQIQSILKYIFNINRDKLIPALREKQEKQNQIMNLTEETQNLKTQIIYKNISIQNLKNRLLESQTSIQKYSSQISQLKDQKLNICESYKNLIEKINNQAEVLSNKRSNEMSEFFEQMINDMKENHKTDINCRQKRIYLLEEQLSLTIEVNSLREEDLLQSLKEKQCYISEIQNDHIQQYQRLENKITSLAFELAVKTQQAEQLKQQKLYALQNIKELQLQRSHQKGIILNLFDNTKQKSFSQILQSLIDLDSVENELVEILKMFYYKQKQVLDIYEEAQQKISELSDDQKKLIKEKQQLILIVEELRMLKKTSEDLKEQLKASTASQKQRQLQLLSEINDLKLKVRHSEEKIKNQSQSTTQQAYYQNCLRQLQQMYEEQKEKIVSNLEIIKDLKAKNQLLQSNSSRQKQEQQNKIQNLAIQLSQSKQNGNKLQMENKELKQNQKKYFQQIKLLRQNIDRIQMNNKRRTDQQESSRSNLNALNKELDILKTENNELKQEVQSKDNLLLDFQKQVRQSQTLLQDSKNKIDELTSQIKFLQAKNRTCQQENQKLQRQLRQKLALTSQPSRTQTSALKIQNDSSERFKRQNSALNDQINSLKREVDQLKGDNKKLQNNAINTNGEIEQNKAIINNLQEMVANMKEEMRELNQEIQNYSKKNKELEKQIGEYTNASRIKVGSSSLRVNKSPTKIETINTKTVEPQSFNTKQVNSNKLFGVTCLSQIVPEGKQNFINRIQQYSQAKIKQTKLLFRLDQSTKTFANVFSSNDSKKWSLAFIFRKNKNIFSIIALQPKIKGAQVCFLISLITGKTVYQSKGANVPALKFDTSNLIIGNREIMIRYESKNLYVASPAVKYFEIYTKEDIFGEDIIKSDKIELQEFQIHRIDFA